MSFSVFASTLVLCSSETVLAFDLSRRSLRTLSLPKLRTTKEIKPHNRGETDSFHGITSVSISGDGHYLSVCTNRKQLCLYRTKDFSLLSNRTLVRAASRVRFTPGNDVIVADKSGDAYLFSTCHPDRPGELLLGHLSMLLDVLVSDDERFVVTADRDEKIRVSHYPNCYNIESFCLGHSKFVTNISELPHDKRMLVSAGGDGELRFWNYVEGVEVKSVGFMGHIEENHVERLNEGLRDLELQEAVRNLPVKRLALDMVNGKSVLISSFYGSGVVLVYQVDGDLGVELLQTICEEEESLECVLSGGRLWILFESGIKVFCFEGTFVGDSEINEALGEVNQTWKELRAKVCEQMFYPILYKRKFDNVQEYQERKKSRMKVSN
ncbi:tRNA (guanine-N(7)-)-methyltransferase non-catalytic subunit WDR4 [Diachasma alloeum]|uniref:tRNA (guanine-N(7)-)-methyltransferase non-catalytic subunit WDR4 n=1 Tax=Diachasma alloeum TaxID=454923 RepID=UPI0007384B47|nr:tRNA (guanine-N(7)-)-methyltransferase non-catalytic subunit WDR4 [Diachasma alloeum]